ncbi:MAG: phosphatase PAP2 family protein [Verrucomicrobiales bacterium]|nr:phosphatase PAP2 family protein [Verrucomicrobiales bacterium]
MGAVRAIQAWDEAAFRWINRDWSAPWLDPWAKGLSGHPAFVPALVVLAVALLVWGGPRGWVFVMLLGLSAGLANEAIAETLKDAVGRARPYAALPDAILRVGRGNPLGSMPSAHAMNMAMIATFAIWYFRRIGWGVAVVALGVGWSRIYNGVHFPADVLAGFALGAGFAATMLFGCERIWVEWVVPRWPGWGRRLPSLLRPPKHWRIEPVGENGDRSEA